MVTIEITDKKLINAFTKEEMQEKTVKYLNSILKSRKRKKIEMEFEVFTEEEKREIFSNERLMDGVRKMEELISKRELGK